MNTIKKLIAAGILLVLAFPMVKKDDNNTNGSSSSGGLSPPPISPSGWDNILNPQYMRNDSCGAGHYGANRKGGRTHKAVDIVCSEHQAVFAPFAGKITRSFNAYDNSTFYKGIELSDEQGTKVKIMYVYPDYNLVGQYVQRGQQIATCQKISNHYSCSMIDHLHIELWQNGVNADVTPYLNV